MSELRDQSSGPTAPFWQPMLFGALAGGMAWGIRGQYGHETGAMIAGLLVSLALVLILCPQASAQSVLRALAWGTVAMGIGGSMTYGQTVGLTHDGPLIGNADALRWGMFGLAVKGGVWIGFAGVFLGMGLGGVRYRPREIFLLTLAMVGGYFIGIALLNSPYRPSARVLPLIYFSDDWRWEPDGDLTPRREAWGGLWVALIIAVSYAGGFRRDRLARNLALWGILGGAVGFPMGQSLQAFHAWNRDLFLDPFWSRLDPNMNWWNMMETTYGAIMGAALGLGLWLNRALIRPAPPHSEDRFHPATEWVLLAVHIPLLLAVEFESIPAVDRLYDLGLIMAIIPMIAIAGGRWWPCLQLLPITLLPIAGKTVRQLVYNEEAIAPALGWFVYLVVPLLIALLAAVWLGRKAEAGKSAREFTGAALLLATWTYFLLNYAFFHFPWPWAEWTSRTPNGIIFAICTLGLTILVFMKRRGERAGAASVMA